MRIFFNLKSKIRKVLFRYPLLKGIYYMTVHRQYVWWFLKYDNINRTKAEEIRSYIDDLQRQPVISVIMPVYNPNPKYLKKAIQSVTKQIYQNWELCIVDDASTLPAIKIVLSDYINHPKIKILYRKTNGHISNASNDALAMARGQYIALLDHDDILPVHALATAVSYINKFPKAKILFSDEDKIINNWLRVDPHFKGGWNRELLYCQNCVSHLGIYDTSLVKKIKGFRTQFEGSQDYDLVLRASRFLPDDQIIHMPHVLYHWRIHRASTSENIDTKSYVFQSSRKALDSMYKDMSLRIKKIDCKSFSVSFNTVFYTDDSVKNVAFFIQKTSNSSLAHLKAQYAGLTAYFIDGKEFFNLNNDGGTKQNIEMLNVEIEKLKSGVIKYVAFVTCDIKFNRRQLSESLGHFQKVTTGTISGKIIFKNKIDSFGLGIRREKVTKLFSGMPVQTRKFACKALLDNNVSLLSPQFILLQKEFYLEIGGISNFGDMASSVINLCLKVRGKNKYNVVLASLKLQASGSVEFNSVIPSATDSYLSPNVSYNSLKYASPPLVDYFWFN